ncbi:response regulator [Candidatus Woesearchaeota archaeon]|nr:response regulator [Candidatus Woesearchaeota archaeon]
MKKKILVVEDEPHISKLVKFILEKNGFEVMQAFVGQEGIEMAKREKPGLIVLDVMMPNMDGFEVAKILTAAKETKDIPIIMLSSAAQFKDKMKGIDSGAIDYITKPFDKDELVAKVKEYIQ